MRPEYVIQIVDFGVHVGFRAIVIVHFQGERWTLVSKTTALYHKTAEDAAAAVPGMIRRLEHNRTVVADLVRVEDAR